MNSRMANYKYSTEKEQQNFDKYDNNRNKLLQNYIIILSKQK
jgi:hypothetical protein